MQKTHIYDINKGVMASGRGYPALGETRMIKGKRWEDHYTRRARAEKWLARSVYKLEEIDKKFKLIDKGYRLLDLGCYPGSWSQYCIKRVGPQGDVTGLDIKRPERLSAPNFRFIKADIFRLDPAWLLGETGLRDTVISDLAPQTTGIKLVDTRRSIELATRSLEIAIVMLNNKGNFLCKAFEGEGLKIFRDAFSGHFDRIRLIRPSAVRKGSREIYLLGLGLLD